LNSVELARAFQTSRTPIREALMLLAREGLIVVPPRRRPAVLVFALQQVREIYNVRGRLLELVATYIAEQVTPHDSNNCSVVWPTCWTRREISGPSLGATWHFTIE
jgi:DNA-binding GntR family transcriptional regulator